MSKDFLSYGSEFCEIEKDLPFRINYYWTTFTLLLT